MMLTFTDNTISPHPDGVKAILSVSGLMNVTAGPETCVHSMFIGPDCEPGPTVMVTLALLGTPSVANVGT